MLPTPPIGASGPVATPPGAPGANSRGPAIVGMAAIVIVALALAGVIVAIAATTSIREVAAGAVDEGGDPSPRWDPRVEPLAAFVAQTRGRPFKHPVAVEFLDDEAFRAKITGSVDEATTEDEKALAVSTAQLRALGLVPADFDLAAQTEQLVGEGTLAFYDSKGETITIRGENLDEMAKVSVVHELTHAWQDQHFDLDRRDTMDDMKAATFRTVAEGDATVVEDRFIDQFTDAESAAYERRSEEISSSVTEGLADVPDVLRALFASPYAIGRPFVQVLDTDGGNLEIDNALIDPPSSEVELLAPKRFFANADPVEVQAPVLGAGQERLDESDFGALALLVTLAERIDPRQALTAVDGWAGDNSVTYRQDGRNCIAVAAVGVDAPATDRLADSFRGWVAAGPTGSASVERTGTVSVLRVCESADAPRPNDDRATIAVQYAAVRLDVLRQVLGQPRTTIDQATCFADYIVAQITPEQLSSGVAVSETEARQRGTDAAIACLN